MARNSDTCEAKLLPGGEYVKKSEIRCKHEILSFFSGQDACAVMPRGTFQVAQVLASIVKPHAGILQRRMTDGSCNLPEMIEALEQQVCGVRELCKFRRKSI